MSASTSEKGKKPREAILLGELVSACSKQVFVHRGDNTSSQQSKDEEKERA